MRHLRRRREGDTASRRIESGDGTARLQRHRRLPARREREFDHLLRRCEGRGDVRGFEARVDQRVLCCHVMDQWRAGCQRLVERHDRRLGGDLDRDLFREIFGLSGGIGDHCGDRLSDIGDAIIGENRLRQRDKIRAIEERTDWSDITQNSSGNDWHFRW